jgi:hypothetical protein
MRMVQFIREDGKEKKMDDFILFHGFKARRMVGTTLTIGY